VLQSAVVFVTVQWQTATPRLEEGRSHWPTTTQPKDFSYNSNTPRYIFYFYLGIPRYLITPTRAI